MSDADDRAIRAILSDQESAWTRGDADGFSKHMAPDFLATNVQGQGMSGKAVFDRQHAFIFAGVFKIDQSFIRDLQIDKEDGAIVDAVVSLGRALNIQVVAEGIETVAQRDFLSALGCAVGKGFLFGGALPAHRIMALLRQPASHRASAAA